MKTHKQDLGTIKEKVEQKFSIPIDNKEIKNIHISCGCTKVQPSYIMKDRSKVLKITYTPSKVPTQVTKGWYQAKQTVTLTYEDNSKFQLIFTAKVIKV